jgi:hypothetical protein
MNGIVKHSISIFNTILNKDFSISPDKLYNIYDNEICVLIRGIKYGMLYIKDIESFKNELKLSYNKQFQNFIIEFDRISQFKNGARRDLFAGLCRKLVSNLCVETISIYGKYTVT